MSTMSTSAISSNFSITLAHRGDGECGHSSFWIRPSRRPPCESENEITRRIGHTLLGGLRCAWSELGGSRRAIDFLSLRIIFNWKGSCIKTQEGGTLLLLNKKVKFVRSDDGLMGHQSITNKRMWL